MNVRRHQRTWGVQVLTAMGWLDVQHAALPARRLYDLGTVLDHLGQPEDRYRITLDGKPLSHQSAQPTLQE